MPEFFDYYALIQGKATIVSILTFGFLALAHNMRAIARYRVVILGMSVLAVIPVISLAQVSTNLNYFNVLPKPTSYIQVDVNGGSQAYLKEHKGSAPAALNAAPENVGAIAPSVPIERIASAFAAILLYASLCASLLLGIRLFANLWLYGRIIRRARPVEKNYLVGLPSTVSGKLSANKIRLLVSRDINSPISGGFFSPAVILPHALLNMPREQFACVLLHEICHVERKDPLKTIFAEAVCLIYAINPFVWLLKRACLRLREYACDEGVILQNGAPDVYAETLLFLAKNFRRRRIVGSVAMADAFVSLSNRCRQFLTQKTLKQSRAHEIFAGLTTTGAGLAVAMTGFSTVSIPANANEYAGSPVPLCEEGKRIDFAQAYSAEAIRVAKDATYLLRGMGGYLSFDEKTCSILFASPVVYALDGEKKTPPFDVRATDRLQISSPTGAFQWTFEPTPEHTDIKDFAEDLPNGSGHWLRVMAQPEEPVVYFMDIRKDEMTVYGRRYLPANIGMRVQDYVNDDGRRGLAVVNLTERGPAIRAGVGIGDIIVSINGEDAPTMTTYLQALEQLRSGSILKLTIDTGGGVRNVEVIATATERISYTWLRPKA